MEALGWTEPDTNTLANKTNESDSVDASSPRGVIGMIDSFSALYT